MAGRECEKSQPSEETSCYGGKKQKLVNVLVMKSRRAAPRRNLRSVRELRERDLSYNAKVLVANMGKIGDRGPVHFVRAGSELQSRLGGKTLL